jgi:hypothetical protein
MNIINALPGILPTARPYTMGQWAQKPMKMRNGRTVKWGLSSRQNGDKLELSWENITYTQAEQLCAIWDANYGILGELTLPPEALAGTSGSLNALLALPFPNAVWKFMGTPQVLAVKAGRCTVRMPIETRFTPLLSYVFSDIYGYGLAEPGSALVAPEIECPEGCAAEFRLMRGNDVIVTNRLSYYVLGTNDILNGKLSVRWQYRCNCPNKPEEPWRDAESRGGTGVAGSTQVRDPWERPGRQLERLWSINILRFGFIGPLPGWRPANVDVTVRTTGSVFDFFPIGGGPPVPAINGEVLEDGVVITIGTFFLSSTWISVVKTRYRDNGGPYIDGPDYGAILS